MKDSLTPLIYFLALLLFTGCSMAWGRHEVLPPAQYAPPREAGFMELYKEGVRPPKGCIRIASLAAHGNGYATRDTLEDTLREEGERVGADFVVVTGMQVTKDETVGAFGGGIAIADTIQRPHL